METIKKSQVAGEKTKNSNEKLKKEKSDDITLLKAYKDFLQNPDAKFWVLREPFASEFPTKLLAAFSHGQDLIDYTHSVINEDNDEIQDLLFQVSQNLSFIETLHIIVIARLRGKFTRSELCCLFQSINGVLYLFDGFTILDNRFSVLNYIDDEGQYAYDLDDIEKFKSKIESMGFIEFEVLVNLIQNAWNLECVDEVVNILLDD